MLLFSKRQDISLHGEGGDGKFEHGDEQGGKDKRGEGEGARREQLLGGRGGKKNYMKDE